MTLGIQGGTMDPTLRALGGRSRYQLLQLLVINMGVWGAAFQLLDNIFIGRKVTWHQCASPYNSSRPDSNTIAEQYPHVDWASDHVIYGQCEITVTEDDHNETFPCLFGHVYDFSRELSFRTEFDLVCGRALMADLLQTLVIMGQACGAFMASFLSDRYGRKPILVWSQLGLLIVGMSIGLAPSYPAVGLLKFMAGCLQQGVMTGKATMSIELFPTEFRSMMALMMAIMWMTGTCTMAVTSFILQNYSWRLLQCVLSSVSLLSFLQLWFVDESLRWLMANGRKDAAMRVLQRAARVNRQDVTVVLTALCGDSVTPDDTDVDIADHGGKEQAESKAERLRKRSKAFDEDWEMVTTAADSEDEAREVFHKDDAQSARELVAEQKPSQKLTLLDVMKHRRLRSYTFLIWATWFTCTFSAFSLYVMSTTLHGNRFLNFFLTASMKLPSGLLFYYMVDRAGRKAAIRLFFLLAAMGLITSAIFRAFEENALFAMLTVPTAMVGAMGATGIFGALFLYTPELYPTNIRQQALGFASVAGRTGGMIAPFMIPLSDAVIWAPGVLTGTMCFGIIFLFRFLPETHGRELPQTLEDIDRWDTSETGTHHEMSLNPCRREVLQKGGRIVQKLCRCVYTLSARLLQTVFAHRRMDDERTLIV